MAYTKVYPAWHDVPAADTPITAAALNQMEQGIVDANAIPPYVLPARLGPSADATITDWNNALSSGWYFAPAGTTNGPPGLAGNWQYAQVTQHNTSWVVQRVWDFTSAAGSQVYERRLLNNVWSSWVAINAGQTGFGTALPSTPADGQEFILTDSVTAPTYQWRFRYVAAKASNKWVFVGGAGRYAEVQTQEGTASTTYVALATAGPSIALPVAGDYDVEIGCRQRCNTSNLNALMSYDIGGTAAVDQDAVMGYINGANDNFGSFARVRRKTGLTAVTLTAKYRAGGGTQQFDFRWMRVTPVAIGG